MRSYNLCNLRNLRLLFILLMLVAQQVVDRLHWIECRQGHLDEDSRPVAHSTIPQAWQLQCLQLLTTLRLLRNEASGYVDILRQVESVAFVVLDSADEVNRIEVCALREHLHIFLV